MRTRALLTAVLVVAVLAVPASASGTTGVSGVTDPARAPAAASGVGSVPHAAAAADCGFPFTATDATGTEVTVEDEPEEIVTLNPSAAQTMWEIGGRDKVVGVSKYASYLEGAETRRNISGGGRTFVSSEKVIGLDPDLVLAPNTISNDTVRTLRDAGLTVYKFPFQESIDDIKRKTLRTGQLAGECAGAEETVAWMDSELRTVREAVEGQDRPRVLYVFFGFTGGTGTFAHTVIETGGGNNIAADANISGYKPINDEVVVDANPEWIVLNDGATGVPETEVYNNTDAVRNDRIVVLQEEYISQPAPRIVRSVVKLARTFHPEAYERAASETTTAAATEGPAGTATEPMPTPTRSPAGMDDSGGSGAEPTTTSTPATTGGSGPGFGIGAPVIALVALLFLGRSYGTRR